MFRGGMYYYMGAPIAEAQAAPEKKHLSARDVSLALHAAIEKRDVGEARKAIEEAFWNKIAFRPNAFHLCRALLDQNREMIRLLVTYGATLSSAEAASVADLMEERSLPAKELLRMAGTRSFPPAAEKDKAFLGRLTQELARRDLKNHFGKAAPGKNSFLHLNDPDIPSLNADQVVLVLDGLHRRMKDGASVWEALGSLALLQETGTDFSKVDASRYLGKNTPGLAKMLLDAGIVSAENFDMKALTKKVGGEIRIFTAKEEKNYAYTEFICQILLEIADSVYYVPFRKEKDPDYQRLFRDKWSSPAHTPHLSYRMKGPAR